MNIRILPATRRAFVKERATILRHVRPVSAETFRLLRTRDDARYLVTLAAVAVVYFFAAKLGLSLAFATEQVSAFWPPTGIALAALLLVGYRAWPGIYLGAFLANVTSNETLLTAAGIAFGNTLAGLFGAFLLRSYYKFHIPLERTRDVLGLVAVAAISTLVSSTLGTFDLVLSDIVSWSKFSSVWWVWWAGDTLGILLLAPFLLSWAARSRVQWREWRLAEYSALFVALATTSYFAFVHADPSGRTYPLAAYATFPFLIWAAFRFEQREVVTSTLLVSAIAVWGAIHNHGPFSFGTLDERLIGLDAFVAVTGITALLLGAVTAERRRSRERLRRARNEMEQRVMERTAQLERANRELYEFSYSMSHDLRAPLRAVNAYSQLLTNKHAEALDGEALRLLGGIAKNSVQMAKMIDDYLRLFRLRNEPLQMKELNVDALTREVIADVFVPETCGKVQFDMRTLPSVTCDPGLIRQVLLNLLDNAVKFSRVRERPIVEIGGGQSDAEVVYYVKDNGVGFDMQWADQLFKVFQRLHPREFEGIGMGLAIVACIVQRHGGRVRAEAEINRGATFSFSLPRHSPMPVTNATIS